MTKPTDDSEAGRWRAARDRYIELGLHPKIAGHLALASMDGALPESLDDAMTRISTDDAAPRMRSAAAIRTASAEKGER